ncbi:MAG: hypothetical protein HYX69_02795 [Planctomycetia bacterium]|nr:hypothetical protein [Planctomycetia bacterium]
MKARLARPLVLLAVCGLTVFPLAVSGADGPAEKGAASAAPEPPAISSEGDKAAPDKTAPEKTASDQATPSAQAGGPATTSAPQPAPIKPKPISGNTQKGLDYLVAQQDTSGGWGQGGGWRQSANGANGRIEGENVKDPPDLGNTCVATLALIRAGNTPQKGPYAKNVARAVAFICQRVERSDKDSLYVTDVRDTQLQVKIGPYVDTFLAGLVMSELKGKMPADGSDKRLLAALDKTVAKIEKNQKGDGTFAGNQAWASVLSQGLCSKFINRAAQNGVAVSRGFFDADFDGSVAELARKDSPAKADLAALAATTAASAPASAKPAEASGPAAAAAYLPAGRAVGGKAVGGAAPSDAGVNLYFFSANASRIADQANTTAQLEKKAKVVLDSASASGDEKQKASDDLRRYETVRVAQQSAVKSVVEQLGQKDFVAGFGNNGGEEFLSYMNISEMLLAKAGPEWEKWDRVATETINRAQNGDGSWSGQHCITGRTFCTSAALLTLLADRAPIPVAASATAEKK